MDEKKQRGQRKEVEGEKGMRRERKLTFSPRSHVSHFTHSLYKAPQSRDSVTTRMYIGNRHMIGAV